ncbi:MAG TPA: hypothetical protein VF372_09870 [Thermodesulfobacteriota bacterium]
MAKHAQSHFVRGDISGLLIAFFLLIYCLKGRSPAPQVAPLARRSSSPEGALLYSSYLIFSRQNQFVNLFPGIYPPLPHGNDLPLEHLFIMSILLCKKIWKWGKMRLSGIEIAEKSQ